MSDWLKKVRLESQVSGNPAGQESSQPETPEPEPMANLTIKVPRKSRDHWVGAARQEGTTLKQVVTDYLEGRYGRG